MLKALYQARGGKPFQLVQFDTHMDYWDEEGGQRYSHASPIIRSHEAGWLSGLTQYGIRSIHTAATTSPWHRAAARASSGASRRRICSRPSSWSTSTRGADTYITFDIDALDPAIAPGTGTPEPGGFSYYEAKAILLAVCERTNVIGMDLVEVAPKYDGPGQVTSLHGARLILSHPWWPVRPGRSITLGCSSPAASSASASPNTRRALPVVSAASSAAVTPRTSASSAAVCATQAGTLLLPRLGTGVRNGRIRLDEEPVGAHARRRLAQIGRVLVGDVAGEARVVAALVALVHVVRQREAVHDDREVAGLRLKLRHRLVAGIPHVHDERQAGAPRQVDLLAEGSALRVPR